MRRLVYHALHGVIYVFIDIDALLSIDVPLPPDFSRRSQSDVVCQVDKDDPFR